MQVALHIALDGALAGVLVIVSIMSSVALHSQYLWTNSFTKLEIIRDLNLRILESTSILENYLFKTQDLSGSLVPTKSKDLIYVDRPELSPKKTRIIFKDALKIRLFERISSFPIKSGY